jgi:hypothetical protein
MCVYFLPTHTIGESVLPAHFLRVIRRLIRRSFMWIGGSFGRPRFVRELDSLDHSLRGRLAFVIRWVILSFILRVVRVIRWVILSLVPLVGVIRWIILRCGRCLLVVC